MQGLPGDWLFFSSEIFKGSLSNCDLYLGQVVQKNRLARMQGMRTMKAFAGGVVYVMWCSCIVFISRKFRMGRVESLGDDAMVCMGFYLQFQHLSR